MDRRGFTLIELIVAISLSVLTLAGVSFFFREATHTLIALGISSRPPIDVANFSGTYRELRAKYPNLYYQTGALVTNSSAAFNFSAFRNTTNTATLVTGAADRRTRKVLLGVENPYVPAVPFLIEIGSADLPGFQSDPVSWTNTRLASLSNPYERVEVARFEVSTMTGSIARLDADIVSTVDQGSYDQRSMRSVRLDPTFEFIPLSIVR